VIIVCVPTPVNSHNRPDYGPLIAASKTIGKHMKRGAVVVFESTVDPGTTEDRCLPVIELHSGMKEGIDFHLGYSPERINPADPTRKLPDIKKIVAGSTPRAPNSLRSSTAASSRQASFRPHRSAWQKLPRFWKTPSATSTSP
jgi:UDP-N-acetyl-D-galactosamine dehydrogenase